MKTKKYLHFEWPGYAGNFAQVEFELLGFEPFVIDYSAIAEHNREEEESVLRQLRAELMKGGYAFVFTFNYFTALARICHELGVRYISFIYDSPWVHLHNDSIFFDTNFIFTFDSHMVKSAELRGAKTLYYLPLFSHPKFFKTLTLTAKLSEKYKADVAFIGGLYEKNEFSKVKEAIKSPYFSGYLDGIISAQKGAYGIDLIAPGFSTEFMGFAEKLDEKGYFPPYQDMGLHKTTFAEGLSRHIIMEIAYMERIDIIKQLSDRFDFKLYTSAIKESIPASVCNLGVVNSYMEAPLVYRETRINLNLTHHGIVSGIPLRCFDIMASGGFLLSNYQSDFDFHFTDGREYVSFHSNEELYDKVDFYLKHESERKKIAQNGYEEIAKHHTIAHRARQMLKTAGIL